MQLQDKIILITGASDGIGRVAAITFAQHGAKVILHGRNPNKLQQVANEIDQLAAQKPITLLLDLLTATPQDYQNAYHQLTQHITHLDGILHNAGILGERVHLIDYPMSIWQDVMTLNVNAPLFLTQILLPLLKQSTSASVLFTSSGVGRAVREQWGAYSISKIALEHISQLLSLENSTSHIRYNCINPGATRTAMRAKAFPLEDPQTLPTAEQIMEMYIYMMSDKSQHLCGQSVDAQQK